MVDDWRRAELDVPSRAEAIRRMVQLAAADRVSRTTFSGSKKKKASEMAGSTIDQLGDKSAPAHEQSKRKRRLLKAPSEFRHIRGDLPKRKR